MLYGSLGAAAGYGIGQLSGLGNANFKFATRVIGGGIISGTIAELAGGNFGQGFTAGAIGAAAGYGMNKLVKFIEESNARKGVTTEYKSQKDAQIRLVVDESLFAGPGADPYHFYAGGTWTEDTCFDASLGQGVKIYTKNVDVVGTTIRIDATSIHETQETILLPQQERVFKYYNFGAEPLHWRFCVSTYSDAFNVLYEIRSTWVPGMPR
jgi:hypothetical protein